MPNGSDKGAKGGLREFAAIPEGLRDARKRLAALEVGVANLGETISRELESHARASTGHVTEVAVAQSRALADAIERQRADVSGLSARLDAVFGAQDALAGTLGRIEMQMSAMQRQLAALTRTAPARGNVVLPGNRLLTRISLPDCFPHGDPILFVNADDKLIVPKLAMNGWYEYESSLFVARNVRPNDHAIDVGANFGYYAVMMAVLAGWKGKVLAFEPHPGMADLLQENTLINWIEPWVKVVRAAVSDAEGTVKLYTSAARAANTGTTIPEIAPGYGKDFTFTAFETPTVRIDDQLEFLGGKVDFMKIDIEGAELLALRGARRTIAANPGIRIMMEWSPSQLQANGVDLHAAAEELKSYGLGLHTMFAGAPPGEVTPMPFEALPEAGYQNVVLMAAN
jgi:FkbM family methyltransferase